jgi:hypothetical protein
VECRSQPPRQTCRRRGDRAAASSLGQARPVARTWGPVRRLPLPQAEQERPAPSPAVSRSTNRRRTPSGSALFCSATQSCHQRADELTAAPGVEEQCPAADAGRGGPRRWCPRAQRYWCCPKAAAVAAVEGSLQTWLLSSINGSAPSSALGVPASKPGFPLARSNRGDFR